MAPLICSYKKQKHAMLQFNKQLLTTVCIATSIAAHAQTETIDSVKMKQQQLQPVEVRALRVGSNAPFAKTEINKAEIDKANFGQDLPYLLQYTPSAVVTSDAGTGIGYTGLRIRGTDGVRMNVTMNGIPVNDAESQGAFFVDFPDIASSMSSIQVQRGVGTSTNGAGAFGATMSLSNLDQADTAGVEMRSGYGSFNTLRNTLKAGTGLLKGGFRFDLRLSQINSEGFIERSSSDLRSLQLIGSWDVTEKTSMRFMVMTGKEKTGQAWNGVPGDSLKTNRQYNELGLKSDGTHYNNQTDNYQQDYYQYFLDHKFSRYLTGHVAFFLTRGKGYYEEYRMGEAFADYSLPDFDTLATTDMIRQLWLDNYYYGSVFSLMYEKNKTSLTFGGGWTQYQGEHYGFVKWAQYGVPDNYRWYMLNSQKNDLNLYVKAQHTLDEKIIFFGDLQYRNVAYTPSMVSARIQHLGHRLILILSIRRPASLTWCAIRGARSKNSMLLLP
jgi:iron complex outermembrane receptor protein